MEFLFGIIFVMRRRIARETSKQASKVPLECLYSASRVHLPVEPRTQMCANTDFRSFCDLTDPDWLVTPNLYEVTTSWLADLLNPMNH